MEQSYHSFGRNHFKPKFCTYLNCQPNVTMKEHDYSCKIINSFSLHTHPEREIKGEHFGTVGKAAACDTKSHTGTTSNLVAPFLILRKLQGRAHVLRPLHPCGKPMALIWPVLATVAIWEANYWHSLSLCNSAIQWNKINLFFLKCLMKRKKIRMEGQNTHCIGEKDKQRRKNSQKNDLLDKCTHRIMFGMMSNYIPGNSILQMCCASLSHQLDSFLSLFFRFT